MRKIRTLIIIGGILLILSACSTAPVNKEYYDIELFMTYSEVVSIIGEPDQIVDTCPGMPWNLTYYEWIFNDGNKLQVRLEYPGKYGDQKDPKNRRSYPDDWVVAHCVIVNESFAPAS